MRGLSLFLSRGKMREKAALPVLGRKKNYVNSNYAQNESLSGGRKREDKKFVEIKGFHNVENYVDIVDNKW